jgi:methyltransferase-like protein/SAM-dependent methyltransferase
MRYWWRDADFKIGPTNHETIMSQQPFAADRPIATGPVPASQPDRLEAIGRLRGMQPAPAAGARVLELACGGGDNLLPLADRYPQARFLGIDPAGARIEAAASTAREAGLANVEFRQQDLLQLDEHLGTFDYIIAHNLYSRDDRPARDKLLAVCRAHLAPQGIAYVSYDTYPGRLLYDMLGHMMRYEARAATKRAETIAQSRKLLDFLQATLVKDHPYDELVRGAAAEVARRGDDALVHDARAPFSYAVYFPQFVEHAKSHALKPAGDVAVGIRLSDALWPSAERQLEALNDDELTREMFRDVLANRAQRQTLLCHAGLELRRMLTPEMFAGMYLAGPLRAEQEIEDLCAPEEAHFTGPSGVRTATASPLVKAALVHLGQAWPDYVRFEDVVAAACARYDRVSPAVSTDEDVARLKENLMHLCVARSVQLHCDRPSFVVEVSGAPQASPLARVQARTSEAVTNRRHEPVVLDPFDRRVVELLDGTRNSDALVEHLAAGVGEGRLVALAHEQPLTSFEDAKRAFAGALPEALARLAKAALLIG